MAHLRRFFEECVFAGGYLLELMPTGGAFDSCHQAELFQAPHPLGLQTAKIGFVS
jgi:hypothetical protein